MTDYNISINESVLLSMDFFAKHNFARSVFIMIVSVVEIPIMLLTLCALFFLIKSHRAASVFVIHLILSDLIQIICLVLLTWKPSLVIATTYCYTLITGLYFMACIAFERYLLVAHPIWHKTHQTLKFSCLISLIIWFVPLIFVTIDPSDLYVSMCIAFLIPYPIIILCFVGTWRGLSHSISLTTQKRRMILGSLLLVLISYTLIILPYTILILFCDITDWEYCRNVAVFKVSNLLSSLLYLNPLCDCLLYLFMRTDFADIMPSLHCCCTSDTQNTSVRYTTRSS